MTNDKKNIKFLGEELVYDYGNPNMSVYRKANILGGNEDLSISLLFWHKENTVSYSAKVITSNGIETFSSPTKDELENKVLGYLKEYQLHLQAYSNKLGNFLEL